MRPFLELIALIIISTACENITEDHSISQVEKKDWDPTGLNFSKNSVDSARESVHLVLYIDFLSLGGNAYKRKEWKKAEKYYKKSEIYLDSILQFNPAFHQGLYKGGKIIYSRLIELGGNEEKKKHYTLKLQKLEMLEREIFD